MNITLFPRIVLAKFICLYQKTITFDHGPTRVFYPYGYCRFYPSCSEYGRQAIRRHGACKGLLLGLKRVLRCHPWSAGGFDEIP